MICLVNWPERLACAVTEQSVHYYWRFFLFTTSVSLGKGRGQHAAIKRQVVVAVRGQCLEI
jgi:hypothetical protein